MKGIKINTLLTLMMLILTVQFSSAQSKEWTLEDCIGYAIEKNIGIQKSSLAIDQSETNYEQSKNNLLPSVNALAGNDLVWGKTYSSETNSYGPLSSSNNTSFGVSAGATLFNGFKLKTLAKQAETDLNSSKYSYVKVKEALEVSILNAYLNILYANEEVQNAEKQIEITHKSLELAEERLELGIISRSDYLQIKSELATEKLTLANANSAFTLAKIDLMQLMELPVSDDFTIATPDIESHLTEVTTSGASDIYREALQVKPQVKEAELNVKSVVMNEKIANADFMPSLSLSAGVNTNWLNSNNHFNFIEQLNNQTTPYVSLNLSIAIFQKNQTKTNVKLAKIAVSNTQLDETEVRNTLRKEVEQAVADASTARIRYEASLEQKDAMNESYRVAEEKYNVGILNSVDFLIIKNDWIAAESNLLQTKYNLVYNIKMLDFYRGNPITL